MKDCLLTILRDKKTGIQEFRHAANQLAELIAADLLSSLPGEPVTIETPLAAAKGFKVAQKIVLIPIYRSGVVLLPAFMSYFPDAPVGLIELHATSSAAFTLSAIRPGTAL